VFAKVPRIILSVVFAGTAIHAQSLAQDIRERSAQAEQALIYLPPAERILPTTIGFREAIADLVWIRAVIATGHPSVGQRLDFIARYLDVISKLAPKFRRPYAWGGVVSVYNGMKITRPMLDQAADLLRRGIERFPEDHEMLFALGMILYRDLAQTPGYTRDEIALATEQGKNYIRQAAAFGASPLVRRLAVTFADEATSNAVEIEFLEGQLLQAKDEELRRALRRKLNEIGLAARTIGLEKLKEELEKRHQERFSYLPTDHYIVLDNG
jgi:hypothetical protein